MGGGGEGLGLFAGGFEADEGGVGRFLGGDVLACAFAEFFGGLGDVEDVVDDLAGEAEGAAEGGESLEFCGVALALMAPRRRLVSIIAAVLHSWMKRSSLRVDFFLRLRGRRPGRR